MSDVDVVVVAFGSATSIGRTLASARPLGAGRAVVVDHGDDGSDRVAARAGALVLRDRSNPGFGAGQNRGVRAGTSEFILLLNPDCEVVAGAVEAGVEHLRTHPGVGVVQGVIMNATTGEPERSQGQELGPLHLWGRVLGARRLLALGPIRRWAGRTDLADHVHRVPTSPRAVEALAATAILVRRSAFDSVGGFDERYFLYGEDLDLCRRLRQAGWDVVALPIPWASHVGGASSAGWAKRELVWWEGTLAFAARWWPAPAFLSALVAGMLRAVQISVRSPMLASDARRRLLVDPVRARIGVVR